LATKAKRPHQEFTPTQQKEANIQGTKDAVYASRPSFMSAPSSSSRGEASHVAIMDQLELMPADFGSRLNHLFDEMC